MSLYFCYNCNKIFTSKEDMGEIETQGPSLLGNNPEKPCKFGLCKRCKNLTEMWKENQNAKGKNKV